MLKGHEDSIVRSFYMIKKSQEDNIDKLKVLSESSMLDIKDIKKYISKYEYN